MEMSVAMTLQNLHPLAEFLFTCDWASSRAQMCNRSEQHLRPLFLPVLEIITSNDATFGIIARALVVSTAFKVVFVVLIRSRGKVWCRREEKTGITETNCHACLTTRLTEVVASEARLKVKIDRKMDQEGDIGRLKKSIILAIFQNYDLFPFWINLKHNIELQIIVRCYPNYNSVIPPRCV